MSATEPISLASPVDGEGPPPEGIKRQNYRDNLEVILTIDGQAWRLIEARVELSKATTPDFVDMIIAPTPETAESMPEDPTRKESNGGLLGTRFLFAVDNEIKSLRDSDEVSNVLFRGRLANMSTSAEGAFEAIAYNPLHEKFNADDGGSFYNTRIDIERAITFPAETGSDTANVSYGVDYIDEAKPRATGYGIRASNLVEQLMEKGNIDDYEIHMTPNGIEQGNLGTRAGRDIFMSVSDDTVTVKQLFERIKASTNSEWWFDRQGTLHIGAPTPGNPVHGHRLQFITDTNAGATTPAYRSVRVIGDGVVSEDGWSRAALRNENPVQLKSNISDAESDGGLAEPTFTYRNMEISTQEEARDVRQKILSKLEEQQAEGKITVVGMPEVRPYDTVEMPDTQTQPMGGARYGVTKVIHKLNGSDGFLTEIHATGLADEQAAYYEDAINSRIQAQRASKNQRVDYY